MLRNQLHVCIPGILRVICQLLQLLPYKIQHLGRDIVMREKEFRAYAKFKTQQSIQNNLIHDHD